MEIQTGDEKAGMPVATKAPIQNHFRRATDQWFETFGVYR